MRMFTIIFICSIFISFSSGKLFDSLYRKTPCEKIIGKECDLDHYSRKPIQYTLYWIAYIVIRIPTFLYLKRNFLFSDGDLCIEYHQQLFNLWPVFRNCFMLWFVAYQLGSSNLGKVIRTVIQKGSFLRGKFRAPRSVNSKQ